MSDPVEDYLDALYLRLRGTPGERRRLLREVEDHLRDAVAEELAAGRTDADARRRAVERCGPADAVAPARGMVRDLLTAGWVLAAVGLVAIGLSGAVAAAMNAAFGPDFVGATPIAAAGNCGHLLAVHPGAGSCARAAVLENSADAVSLRVLAGLVGVLMLGAYLAARRRGWTGGGGTLPAAFVPVVGSVLLVGAGAVLTGIAVDTAAVSGADGTGFFLSGGVAALAVAGVLLIPLRRMVPIRWGPARP